MHAISEGARRLRLVALDISDGDPHWCELVLRCRRRPVHPSWSRECTHRGFDITPGTQLVMVEDI